MQTYKESYTKQKERKIINQKGVIKNKS